MLPPGADEFTVSTEVLIDFRCGKRDDRQKDGHDIILKFEAAALCKPVVANSSPGTGSIGISLIGFKLAGIRDQSIEQILECILARFLGWALSQVTIPFSVFTIDGVSLTLQQGPIAQDDQIEVLGDIS